MNDTQIKALVALVMFGTWVALVVFKVPNADDLIDCIKGALLGLGFYHVGMSRGTPAAGG